MSFPDDGRTEMLGREEKSKGHLRKKKIKGVS